MYFLNGNALRQEGQTQGFTRNSQVKSSESFQVEVKWGEATLKCMIVSPPPRFFIHCSNDLKCDFLS